MGKDIEIDGNGENIHDARCAALHRRSSCSARSRSEAGGALRSIDISVCEFDLGSGGPRFHSVALATRTCQRGLDDSDHRRWGFRPSAGSPIAAGASASRARIRVPYFLLQFASRFRCDPILHR